MVLPYLSPAIRIGVQAQICGLVTVVFCNTCKDPVCAAAGRCPVSPDGKGQFKAVLAQTPFP
ncbi:hypothetical protein I79_017619 [Cricetulus griseus]|uniref:Uncharacterized protein n=1 Tax=Cricetulus griseus TaxID=10029 RepID=G3I2I6_CRIGR|nr:hypothetical protein I79_017619 [Cricetulus griseus]